MGRKNAVQGVEQSGFPIDQRPIAIKGEDLEAAEVEHGDIISDSKNTSQRELPTLSRTGARWGDDDPADTMVLR